MIRVIAASIDRKDHRDMKSLKQRGIRPEPPAQDSQSIMKMILVAGHPSNSGRSTTPEKATTSACNGGLWFTRASISHESLSTSMQSSNHLYRCFCGFCSRGMSWESFHVGHVSCLAIFSFVAHWAGGIQDDSFHSMLTRMKDFDAKSEASSPSTPPLAA